MTSLFSPTEAPRRHSLVFVLPERWRSLIERRGDLGGEPIVAAWADRGWPLVARRPLPGEPHGLALGLPLPPTLGKRRIAVTMRLGDVVAVRPPPSVEEVIHAAPEAWAESLRRLSSVAASFELQARVFGSLAWRAITGLPYLMPTSDLDLLLPCPRAVGLPALTARLAEIAAAAPMRIDGELVSPDGCAVNWREIDGEAEDLLVKSASEVRLMTRTRFIETLR